MTRIEAIKQRVGAATPWPWRLHPGLPTLVDAGDPCEGVLNGKEVCLCHRETNAVFIAHAPQDLRDLLDLYDAATEMRLSDFGDPTKIYAVLARLDAEVE